MAELLHTFTTLELAAGFFVLLVIVSTLWGLFERKKDECACQRQHIQNNVVHRFERRKAEQPWREKRIPQRDPKDAA